MSSIKTAISMDKELFQQVDELAKELEVSRSYFLCSQPGISLSGTGASSCWQQ